MPNWKRSARCISWHFSVALAGEHKGVQKKHARPCPLKADCGKKRNKEDDRPSKLENCVSVCISTLLYIYIHIYTHTLSLSYNVAFRLYSPSYHTSHNTRAITTFGWLTYITNYKLIFLYIANSSNLRLLSTTGD